MRLQVLIVFGTLFRRIPRLDRTDLLGTRLVGVDEVLLLHVQTEERVLHKGYGSVSSSTIKPRAITTAPITIPTARLYASAESQPTATM